MTEDGALIALVAAVWAALAALYALVPMFDMPGSALVWGSGAALFAALAVAIARAERRSGGH
jgi:hypothetical protein